MIFSNHYFSFITIFASLTHTTNNMSLKKFKTDFAKMMETFTIPDNISQEESDKKWSDLFSYLQSNIPNKLYRFRKCRLNDIISLEQGTISLCTAAQFSDKYDSNIFYDHKAFIKNAADSLIKSIKMVLSLKESYRLPDNPVINKIISLEKNNIPIHEISQCILTDYMTELFSYAMLLIDKQELLPRKNKATKIACFTEDIKSKFMWDAYGDGYQGFALEYDFKNFQSQAQLYPIIYSNRMYDGSKVIDNIVVLHCMEVLKITKQKIVDQFITAFKKDFPVDELHWIKMYLYKDKKTYSHEKEWRLLYKSNSQKDFCSIHDENCLKAIYYGPDINDDYKKHLHNIAKSKGLKEYDVVIDKDSLNYDLKITSMKL